MPAADPWASQSRGARSGVARQEHLREHNLSVALARRLRRNYIWMFLILLLAWVLKIASPKLQEGASADTATPIGTIVGNAALGPIPGWAVIVAVAIFYAALLWVVLSRRHRAGEDEVHV